MRNNKVMDPINVGGISIKNRVLMPAMSTNFANHDGTVSPKLYHHYLERAKGGVGLIVVEAASVAAPAGRIANNQLVINDESKLTGYQTLIDGIHAFNTKVLLQLHHGGFKANPKHSEGLQSVSSSEISGMNVRAATLEEIQRIEEQFITAAVYAKRAGFDGVELHAAHSYLLNQFISPHINTREDEYGGTAENRFRILRNILSGIRKKCPRPFILSVRLGLVDNFPVGLVLEEGVQIAKWCEACGADLLNISAGFGDTSVATQWDPPGKFNGIAETVKRAVDIPVAVVGKFRDPSMCAKLIENGTTDMVAIGRQLLCDPQWPNKILMEREDMIRPCLNCNEGCIARFGALDAEVNCVLNPYVGHDDCWNEYTITPAKTQKKVAIIGGGVAGMQAAITAKKRGHDVKIFEKSNRLGGQMHFAAKPPFKSAIKYALQWFVDEVGRLSIPVHFNTSPTAEYLSKENIDCVILACGSTANSISIPGIETAVDFASVFAGAIEMPENEKVVVIGGGQVGCELAYLLCERNCEVTIIEVTSEICRGMEAAHRQNMTNYLVENATLILNANVVEITADGVTYAEGQQNEAFCDADTVIYAVGRHPVGNEVYDALISRGIMAYKIGECRQSPGNLLLATREAQAIAMAL